MAEVKDDSHRPNKEGKTIERKRSVVDFDEIIAIRSQRVLREMKKGSSEEDMRRLKEAFEFALKAHSSQKRKTGEPYILHPIAVATIAAEELHLDVDSVIAAFLHDVVEDTEYTLEDIRERFGNDVAYIVDVVTKKKKEKYRDSKQVDNFRQMLESVQHDVRPLLVKLADRLHNMRTLSSMRPDKQMKIAGETDYFYAPLANRLGLYNVKTELENLSLKFRCPHDYDEMKTLISRDEVAQHARLKIFVDEISTILEDAGIDARVQVVYRKPYSIWRKMRTRGEDFNHLNYRHFTDIVFRNLPPGMTEKDMVLRIYSLLTNRFKEKPGGISNYIDSPKDNGYQGFHIKLLADFGRWQEVHISSERMAYESQVGCSSGTAFNSISRWLEKFRELLRENEKYPIEGELFMENVVDAFYNDDIMTFTPMGKPVILPQKSTVIDFAYEVGKNLGENAKYARVNGFLSSIKSRLRRGDVVEVFTDPLSHPGEDWLQYAVTYKAKNAIRGYLAGRPKSRYSRCACCNPIPGEEVIGYKGPDGEITVHKRDCPIVIKLATQRGDDIISVDFDADETLYPVTILIRAVDRFHLLIDIVECITNSLGLTIDSFNTTTEDNIVEINISFAVHSFNELETIFNSISAIESVDEVKRIKH